MKENINKAFAINENIHEALSSVVLLAKIHHNLFKLTSAFHRRFNGRVSRGGVPMKEARGGLLKCKRNVFACYQTHYVQNLTSHNIFKIFIGQYSCRR